MPDEAPRRQAPSATVAGSLKSKLDFKERESAELVLGISGAIGSGTEFVVRAIRSALAEHGYQIVHLKLSNFIEMLLNNKLVPGWDASKTYRNRYERLQLAGNQLRDKRAPDFLAELTMAVISNLRILQAKSLGAPSDNVSAIVPKRVAYLVDQLKHPDEVRLLRRVYGNLFYLIGVLTSEKQRIQNLCKKLPPAEVTDVVERDKQDDESHGQQLEKTLKLADYFIRNNLQNDSALEEPLTRFFHLIHGQTARTPTKSEYAMYAAFSAGLRSACLSRQVGASIADQQGNVLSTGCNDVPKGGGGLYTEEDRPGDHRCINLEGGVCFNDRYKDELGSRIRELLIGRNISPVVASELASEIRFRTPLKDLLEFSRSVHAEMDALISLVRKGGPSVVGGSLYTTTFPCHNCARHIVAAGISKVFYIEPYEKSLALSLHRDSIASDSEESTGKVQFLHFEGVAPRQYQELFLSKAERKDGASAVRNIMSAARKTRPQYLDSYRDLESKVVASLLSDQGLSKEQIVELSDPLIASAVSDQN